MPSPHEHQSSEARKAAERFEAKAFNRRIKDSLVNNPDNRSKILDAMTQYHKTSARLLEEFGHTEKVENFVVNEFFNQEDRTGSGKVIGISIERGDFNYYIQWIADPRDDNNNFVTIAKSYIGEDEKPWEREIIGITESKSPLPSNFEYLKTDHNGYLIEETEQMGMDAKPHIEEMLSDLFNPPTK